MFDFFRPSNSYSTMLNKLAWANFAFVIFNLYFLYYTNKSIADYVNKLPLEIQIQSVSIPIVIVLASIVISIGFRVIKLHDCISDLFKIREKYDIYHVLIPYLFAVGQVTENKPIEFLTKNRKVLMKRCFYRYISGVEKDKIISDHDKELALDSFFWYWLLIEAGAVVFLMSIVVLIIGNYFMSTIYLYIVILMFLVSRKLKETATNYTANEVEIILSNQEALKAIEDEINALSG